MGQIALVLTVFALGGCGGQAPDVVLLNGKVFTANPAQPWAEALAIRGARIVAVGDTATVTAQAGRATHRIDLGGRTVVPGLNDAHMHAGPELPTTRLGAGDNPTTAELETALASAVATAPPGQLIQGALGEAVWEDGSIARAWLDTRAPRHPVRLRAWHGHGAILNSAALSLAGVDESIGDPEGGHFQRDAAGRLNGRLEEYAVYLVTRRLALKADQASAGAASSAFTAVAREAAAYGITSLQLMNIDLPVARTMPALVAARTGLRWRVYRVPMREGGADTADGRPHLPPQPGPGLDARGMKFIFDGTPVERLAFVRAPYADRPRDRGRLNFTPDRMREFAGWGYGSEDQMAAHAVGDGAIDAYLTALEQSGVAEVWQRKRPRIEHGDMLSPDLIARAKALGAVLVQNPAHLTLAAELPARLGPDRAREVQPLKSLLAAGVPLALGSDGPLNPFLNIMFATLHPVRPSEALTREEAVTAYTRGSAFAEGQDQDKGHLSPGAYADLAVLSADVFTVPPDQLPGVKSVLTLVGGVTVFDGKVLP